MFLDVTSNDITVAICFYIFLLKWDGPASLIGKVIMWLSTSGGGDHWIIALCRLGKTSQIKYIKRTRLVMCTFELDTDPALAAVLRIKVARHMIQVHQTIIPNCKIPTMPVLNHFFTD